MGGRWLRDLLSIGAQDCSMLCPSGSGINVLIPRECGVTVASVGETMSMTRV